MTVKELELALDTMPQHLLKRDVQVLTSGDFYTSPGGKARFGYACSCMGDHSWSETARPYYDPVFYLPSSSGPD